ncbi:DUF3606 domain-containing protein, partial [Ferrovibrio sp.]|uniref:DUF3606 domain-containing protein n=1 Tax=Ferrovibrio sp. TaxID=1917215 RepID=UPI000CC5215C
GPADRSHVNVGEDYERRWWSEKFRVRPEVLDAAVESVGTSVNDVAKVLGKNPS